MRFPVLRRRALLVLVPLLVAVQPQGEAATPAFAVEESTISDLHTAIVSGQTTCQQVVQAYLARVKAYNGVCTALVTRDGGNIAPATGPTRLGKALTFPTRTIAASTIFPQLDQYRGLPLEFGRMEPTLSDPTVKQQYGLRVGLPNAGQVNALETLNIRGERSLSCKATCDTHPSKGSLPASCPKACDAFRQQPDALERAAELDREFGSKPDLAAMPMYCVAFAWKNWYDAKDMRATGGNDTAFALDFPPADSPDVARLRATGAISLAVANAARAGVTAAGPEKPRTNDPSTNVAYGVWGGQPCNPYDTERVPRGSSSGSGVAVATNLAACSICEQTGGSCKGPASRNNIVSLLTTKGITMDGGYGYQALGDRAGIHCRTVTDAVKVLDVIKGYESSDIYRALPPGLVPKEPYASFLVDAKAGGRPLRGVRVAIAREFMVKHTPNDVAISDQMDAEMKRVLRDQLGAELVESIDPQLADDPSVPNLRYTFAQAMAEVLPGVVPEYFWQKNPDGSLEFAVPGWDVTSVKYAVAVSTGKAPLSPRLNLRRISKKVDQYDGAFGWDRYLALRGDTRITDWAAYVRNTKFDIDEVRAGSVNAANVTDARADFKPGSTSISYVKMQTALRLIVQKVMSENGIDVFVNPETTLPPYRLGRASEPVVDYRDNTSCCQVFTALLGGPEMEVPAGYTQTAYEPEFALSKDGTDYVSVAGKVATPLPNPMPISLMLWAAPGHEPAMIRVSSAYESASRHRAPPPAFGPVKGTRP
jgi:Asp-tRNA(Asn)/Glu-tRNA(Gln) amidotransferase A subunit family amidase